MLPLLKRPSVESPVWKTPSRSRRSGRRGSGLWRATWFPSLLVLALLRRACMLNFSISVVMLLPNFKPKPHQPLLRLWCPKGARGARITSRCSKFIEICWLHLANPPCASASATFWFGCLGGSLPSSFRVRVCFGLLLSSFSRERPSAEQTVGSGKQCLACTWQAATGPALGGWSSSGASASHGGSLRAFLWSPTSRWTPLGQHGGLHPLLRLLARCFRRMLSSGRILSSNASVTSVLVNLFCLLVAFLSLPGAKWSLLAWSLATN